MNIFKFSREIKRKTMKLKQDFRDYKTESPEEIKELTKLRIRAEERKKRKDEVYKEETKIKNINMNLRKRTPTYRIIDAIKENKVKKNRFGKLPGENFNW